MNLNKVFISGNLTRDPELRDVNGTELARFSVAVARKWRDKNGEQQKEVSYVDCTAWGKTAATIGQYFTKGKPILIEGRLKQETWTGQDGAKRSKLGIVVESFQFVPDGGRGEARGVGPGGAHAAPAAAPAAADNIDGPPLDDGVPF